MCSSLYLGFPDGSDGKESACNAGDLGSIPGFGRSSGEGNYVPLIFLFPLYFLYLVTINQFFFFFYVYESVSVLYIDSFVLGFPGGSDGKECACSAEDSGSIPGSRRSLGEGNGYLLQYSCLEDSKQKGVWQPTVHVAKS